MFKYFSLSQQRVLLLVGLFGLGLLYLRFYSHLHSSPPEIYPEVVIEVVGSVRNPGIQIHRAPPSLGLALEKAGGFNGPLPRGADSPSEVLETGTRVMVTRESPAGRPAGDIFVRLGRMDARKLLVFSVPLDLNRVTVEDLCLIPGIGEPLALDIMRYREKRKLFGSVSELKNVRGIGDKKWRDFSRYLTVSLPALPSKNTVFLDQE